VPPLLEQDQAQNVRDAAQRPPPGRHGGLQGRLDRGVPGKVAIRTRSWEAAPRRAERSPRDHALLAPSRRSRTARARPRRREVGVRRTSRRARLAPPAWRQAWRHSVPSNTPQYPLVPTTDQHVVGKGGLEPPRAHALRILSPMRGWPKVLSTPELRTAEPAAWRQAWRSGCTIPRQPLVVRPRPAFQSRRPVAVVLAVNPGADCATAARTAPLTCSECPSV